MSRSRRWLAVRRDDEGLPLQGGPDDIISTKHRNQHNGCGGQNPGSEPWVVEEAQAIATAYQAKTACLEALGLRRRARMTSDEARRVVRFDRMLSHWRRSETKSTRPSTAGKSAPSSSSETATRARRLEETTGQTPDECGRRSSLGKSAA
jgi:hypothetical protein